MSMSKRYTRVLSLFLSKGSFLVLDFLGEGRLESWWTEVLVVKALGFLLTDLERALRVDF